MGRSNNEPMQLLFPGLSSSANLHDRFEIGRELGRGGGGVVHACHSLVTGRPIAACKSIPKYKLQRREVLMELRNEVDTMLKLRGHPHIVELQGLYEDAGAVHLIMDLCEGGDLYEYLAANVTLPEKVAAMVVRQVLLALRHCHENGVVHRDVKPENILITKPLPTQTATNSQYPPLHLKLADFGLAMRLRAGEKAMGMYGSSVYMAPEVVCRRGCSTPVDIWSLGVILYTALCGYMPFWGSTEEDLFLRILRNNPDFEVSPWPTVSRQAIDLVRWMLSTDPAQRPTSLEALNHPWVVQNTADLRSEAPRSNGSLGVIPPSPSAGPDSSASTPTRKRLSEPSTSSATSPSIVTTEVKEGSMSRADSGKSTASTKSSSKANPDAIIPSPAANEMEEDGVVLASPSSSASARSTAAGKSKPGSTSSTSSTTGRTRDRKEEEAASDGELRVSAESAASPVSTMETASAGPSPSLDASSAQEDLVIMDGDEEAPSVMLDDEPALPRSLSQKSLGSVGSAEAGKAGVKRKVSGTASDSKRPDLLTSAELGDGGLPLISPSASMPSSVRQARPKADVAVRKSWNGEDDRSLFQQEDLEMPVTAVPQPSASPAHSDTMTSSAGAPVPAGKASSVPDMQESVSAKTPPDKREERWSVVSSGAVPEKEAATPGGVSTDGSEPATPQAGKDDLGWGAPLIADSPLQVGPSPSSRGSEKSRKSGSRSRSKEAPEPVLDMQDAVAAARRDAAAEAEQAQRQRAREIAARARGGSSVEAQLAAKRAAEASQDSDSSRKSPVIPPVTADVVSRTRQPVRDPRPKGEPVLLPGGAGGPSTPSYPRRPTDRRSSTPQRRQMEQPLANTQAQPRGRAPSPLPQGARPGRGAPQARASSPFRFLRLSSYGRRSAHRPYSQADAPGPGEPAPGQEGRRGAAGGTGAAGSPEDTLKPPSPSISPQLQATSPSRRRFTSPQRRPTSPAFRLLSRSNSKEPRSTVPFSQTPSSGSAGGPNVSPSNSVDMSSRQAGSPRRFLSFSSGQRSLVPRSQTADTPGATIAESPSARSQAEAARPFSPRMRPLFSPMRRRQNSMSGNIPSVAASTPSLSDLPRRDLGGMFSSFNRRPSHSGTLAPTWEQKERRENRIKEASAARPRSGGGRVPRSASADRAPSFMPGGIFRQVSGQPGGSGRSDFVIPGLSANQANKGKKSSKSKSQDLRSSQESSAGGSKDGSTFVSPSSNLSSPAIKGSQELGAGKVSASPSPLLLPASKEVNTSTVGRVGSINSGAGRESELEPLQEGAPAANNPVPEKPLGIALSAVRGRSSSEPVRETPAGLVAGEGARQAPGPVAGATAVATVATPVIEQQREVTEKADAVGPERAVQTQALAGSSSKARQQAFMAPEQWVEPSPRKAAAALAPSSSMGRSHAVNTNGDTSASPHAAAKGGQGRVHAASGGEAVVQRSLSGKGPKAAQGAGVMSEISTVVPVEATPEKEKKKNLKKMQESPPTLERVMSRGLVQGVPLVSPFRPAPRSFMRTGSANPGSVGSSSSMPRTSGAQVPSPSPSKAARPSSPLKDRLMRFASPGRMRNTSGSAQKPR